MFIQVIHGKVKDVAAGRAAGERWQAQVRPVAKGYLGGTTGITEDGTMVAVIRFESEGAANANSALPEQDAWWAETSKNFVDEPTFYNCPDVELLRGGGSDEAGFVQVMIYKPNDVDAIRALAAEFERMVPLRPDLLGATTAFATDGTVIDTNYFTSEAEAREGEKEGFPAEMDELMRGFQENAGEITFIDLKDPQLD